MFEQLFTSYYAHIAAFDYKEPKVTGLNQGELGPGSLKFEVLQIPQNKNIFSRRIWMILILSTQFL